MALSRPWARWASAFGEAAHWAPLLVLAYAKALPDDPRGIPAVCRCARSVARVCSFGGRGERGRRRHALFPCRSAAC